VRQWLALPINDPGSRKGSEVSATPRPLHPGEGGFVGLRADLDELGGLIPSGLQTTDFPALSESLRVV